MNNTLSTKVPAGIEKTAMSRLLTPEDIAVEISRPVRYVLTLIRDGDGKSRLPATRIGGKTYRIDPRVWEEWKAQRTTA